MILRDREMSFETQSLWHTRHIVGVRGQGTAWKTLGRARFNRTGPRGQSLANGAEKLGNKDSLCVICIKSDTQGQRFKEVTTREDLN